MNLLEQLDGLQQGMCQFRRVALHVHSPGSYDWPRPPFTERDQRRGLLDDAAPYLQTLARHYDLVAVTDHMHSSFACDQCNGPGGPVVLPGMELSVQLAAPFLPMRVHFLAIFPEGYSADLLERVFSNSNVPGVGERRGDEALQVQDVKEVVARVKSNDGVIIAAHVDSDGGGGYRAAFRDVGAGVLQLVCDERELPGAARDLCDQFKRHLVEARVDAVEIHRAEDARHYRFHLGDDNLEVATVLRNDAHSLGELERGWCSYMKMSEPSFRGLQQAIRFPDTRIRHTPPIDNLSYIEGIRIAGSEGHFTDTTLALSPNLTCIIGARGTGKSAIVDAIRYAFGYNRSMGDNIDKDLADRVRGRQKANLEGAKIEVVYRGATGERSTLVSQYDKAKDYTTVVLDSGGRETGIADVEEQGGFPCRLYGWGEIEKLSRDAARQRALLDYILGLHGLLGERQRLLGELGAQRATLKGMVGKLELIYRDPESTELRRLSELTEQFAHLQKPEMDALFAGVESANADLAAAKEWETSISGWLVALRKAVVAPASRLDPGLSKRWEGVGGTRALADVEAAAGKLLDAADSLLSAATELRVACAEGHTSAAAELNKQLEGNADIEVLAGRRKQVGPDLERAKAEKLLYEREFADLRAELTRRRELVRDLRAVCARLSAARSEGIAAVRQRLDGQPGPDIGLLITAKGDLQSYDKWIDGALRAEKAAPAKRAAICATLKARFGIDGTVDAMLDGSVEECELHASDLDRVRAAFSPFYTDEASGVTRVNAAVLDRTLTGDECVADDVVEVTLGTLPVGSLSPGQVCSALLPIVLLGSDSPLILDQPEDNLDNQLITELLIAALHEQKQRRQIVIVTHNPNIVVNGDAEQVIVMDSPDGGCGLRRQASIDDEGIMRDIMDLMEGGKQALRNRFRRYGMDGEVPEFLR